MHFDAAKENQAGWMKTTNHLTKGIQLTGQSVQTGPLLAHA